VGLHCRCRPTWSHEGQQDVSTSLPEVASGRNAAKEVPTWGAAGGAVAVWLASCCVKSKAGHANRRGRPPQPAEIWRAMPLPCARPLWIDFCRCKFSPSAVISAPKELSETIPQVPRRAPPGPQCVMVFRPLHAVFCMHCGIKRSRSSKMTAEVISRYGGRQIRLTRR
jgi:hypothetical protein